MRAAGLLPARAEGWRGSGGAAKVKVTVLQQLPKAGKAAAASLDTFLHTQLQRDGRKADILILPENWLGASGHADVATNSSLQLLADVAKAHAVYILAGTMAEVQGGKRYVTSVLLAADGTMAGLYRKRKPTMEGAHDPGNEVGIFETPHGRIAVMICFDVENADIFEETLSHDPVVILNPTWIPLPRVISTMPSVASPSCSYPLSLLTAWGNAMETMSHKFENICIERGIYLVRCDMPYNCATGTSQVIAPHYTAHAATLKETHLSVFLERDREQMMKNHARFVGLFAPAERERTERRDRTGSRYTVRSISGHTSPVLDVQLVDPVMKALSCSASGEIKLWNVNTRECLKDYQSSPVVSLFYDDKHRTQFWSASLCAPVCQWDLPNGLLLRQLQDMVATTKITHSNAGLGEGILCGGFDGTVTHVDTREFNQRLQFCASGGAIRDLTTVGDYSIATAAGEVVQIWDSRKSEEPVRQLTGHTGPVSCLAKPGDARLISGSYDGTLRYWDLASGSCFHARKAHEREVTGVCSINDAFQLSVSMDGTMKLWRLPLVPSAKEQEVECLHTFEEHTEPIYGVRYNGRDRVITFGEHENWKMWKFTQDMHPLSLSAKLLRAA